MKCLKKILKHGTCNTTIDFFPLIKSVKHNNNTTIDFFLQIISS